MCFFFTSLNQVKGGFDISTLLPKFGGLTFFLGFLQRHVSRCVFRPASSFPWKPPQRSPRFEEVLGRHYGYFQKHIFPSKLVRVIQNHQSVPWPNAPHMTRKSSPFFFGGRSLNHSTPRSRGTTPKGYFVCFVFVFFSFFGRFFVWLDKEYSTFDSGFCLFGPQNFRDNLL